MAMPLSLAPGFSRVSVAMRCENRFNGFPRCAVEAVETAGLCSSRNTRLKPGANEMALKELAKHFSTQL